MDRTNVARCGRVVHLRCRPCGHVDVLVSISQLEHTRVRLVHAASVAYAADDTESPLLSSGKAMLQKSPKRIDRRLTMSNALAEPLLTPREIAETLQVSRATVERW